jgi:hypothetical protein
MGSAQGAAECTEARVALADAVAVLEDETALTMRDEESDET